MRRGILPLVLVALLALSLAPVSALAADVEGQAAVTGKVTVAASQPTVSFQLYSDSGYTTTTTEITPQTPVYMKISVSGNNPLEEATITVKLFADNDNTAVGTPPSTTSPETYVTFTISYDTNSGQWTLTSDTGGSRTWNIQLDPAQRQADPTSSSGDFYVIITFGKTAREANTGDTAPYADWDIIVDVTIGSVNPQTGSNSANGYTVYFYSEVTTSASTIDFGTIEAGQSSVIQSVDGNTANSFTVLVIANGYYDLKATSDATWTTSDGYSISLVAGSPGDGQFALQVDDAGDTNGAPTQPVYVTSDVTSAQAFVDNANPTDEAGATHTIYMQITLGTNIHTGTYQGSIAIHAVDGA